MLAGACKTKDAGRVSWRNFWIGQHLSAGITSLARKQRHIEPTLKKGGVLRSGTLQQSLGFIKRSDLQQPVDTRKKQMRLRATVNRRGQFGQKYPL